MPSNPSPGRLLITPAQCRAARGLLDWTQQELAQRAGVALGTIKSLESHKRLPYAPTAQAILACLETAGVVVGTEGDGTVVVKLRPISQNAP